MRAKQGARRFIEHLILPAKLSCLVGTEELYKSMSQPARFELARVSAMDFKSIPLTTRAKLHTLTLSNFAAQY